MKSSFSSSVSTVKATAGIAAVGTAAVATSVAFNSMNKAANFESQMTKAGVIAGASSSELKKLSDEALKLGATSSLSASEVSVAMTELGAKGMDTNKIIAAMPGILAAAEASGEDLAMTSDVVTSALNAFELKASDANHVADVMAMSANKTAAGVMDLGYSFKYSAPLAKTVGISLEELAAVTGIMVDKGLSGEQAGTALRMSLSRLADPPKEASTALDKLNISVTDSQGEFKSLAEIAGDWNKATKDLTQTQKVQYATTVFGTEAATGMLNIFSAGPDKINQMTTALVNSEGSAMDAAKAMKDNYGGALEELKGSIESAQIKFSSPILPVFQDLFSGLSAGIDGKSSEIEKAGQKLAAGLSDIFEPFSVQMPVKPEFNANDMRMIDGQSFHSQAMAQYEEDLKKFNKYKDMDFSDKFVYMLDETMGKTESWLSGSGGESMNKIFSQLGEMAAKSWASAFTGAVKSSASNLMEGNVAAAAGTGFAAWMLGGGLMVKGAKGATKWGLDKLSKKGSNKKMVKAQRAVLPTSTPEGSRMSRHKGKQASVKSLVPQGSKKAIAQVPAKGGNALKWLGKSALGVAKKAVLPVALAAEAYNIFKSKDKAKTAVQAGSGIAGGIGGAKAGAALGTALAPGIGSIIGGIVGGLGGYVGGKFFGGKAVDKTRQASQAAPTSSSNAVAALPDTKALEGSFKDIKTNADKVKDNLELLTMWTGQASGWLASLKNIQTAGDRVVEALNNLETRINNIELPKVQSKRVSFND
ncbi:phage tail tape measure protein [Cytobacillus sp. IB215665]|uniref:phage tail tape measure protein n=1 Tax=Cytobacillus sp. IB215665 TaxID=3097357 RepID=UPI002A186789|nr:phage tail tape measure protein [Cytobacillus sp. IB215665]MDX8367785.1 phage tail tape measure protein [Cytobacillus sp. IB215665]